MCYLLIIYFHDGVSLHSPSCPKTYSIYQASFKFNRFTYLCLLSAGIKGVHHHCPAAFNFSKIFFLL